MKPVFVDTSFLIALALRDDPLHGRSVRWQKSGIDRLLTTQFILLEFCDALSVAHLRPLAIKTVSVLRNSPSVTVVPVSTLLFDAGLELFQSRSDKAWGLTDCISFHVMSQFGASDALTADRHFEQAGFNALLKQDTPV